MNRLILAAGMLLSLLAFAQTALGQANLLSGKTVGVYISSRAVTYGENFYLPIAQFVTQEDDAAWNGRLKSEFLVKLGWMVTGQLQELAEADTVFFMNADLPMGRAMQTAYDPETRELNLNEEALKNLDVVLVLEELAMETRNHRSVYIRSNRMITENIPIKTASCQLALFDLHNSELKLDTRVCLDDMNTPAPGFWHFDFYRSTSGMGKFLSKVFSTWWELMLAGERSSCEASADGSGGE